MPSATVWELAVPGVPRLSLENVSVASATRRAHTEQEDEGDGVRLKPSRSKAGLMTPTGNASVGVFAFWGGVVMADQERKSAQRTTPKEDETKSYVLRGGE
jgi:hypothetical protein